MVNFFSPIEFEAFSTFLYLFWKVQFWIVGRVYHAFIVTIDSLGFFLLSCSQAIFLSASRDFPIFTDKYNFNGSAWGKHLGGGGRDWV